MMRVKVYDKYRFAIPVEGVIVQIGSRIDGGEGVRVKLTTTNNPQYPVGSNIWVHRQQLKAIITDPKPTHTTEDLSGDPF